MLALEHTGRYLFAGALAQPSALWVERGLSALFYSYKGRIVDAFGNQKLPAADTSEVRQGGISDFNSAKYVQFTKETRYEIRGALGATVVGLIYPDAFTNYGGIIACQDTSTTNGWEIRLGKGSTEGNLLTHRSNSGYEQWYSSITEFTADGTQQFFSVIWLDNLIQSAPYVVTPVTPVAKQLNTVGVGAGTGAVGAATADLYIGKRYDSATYLDGGIALIALFHRALDFAQVYALRANPWQLFEPDPLTIFWPKKPAVAGGITGPLIWGSHLLTNGPLIDGRLAA